jgi:hypothetical protein
MRRFADFFQFTPRKDWPLGTTDNAQTESIFNGTKARLKTIPIFVIDNVAQWYLGINKSESISIKGGFRPMIAPPFDEFWMECSIPTNHFTSMNYGIVDMLQGVHCIVIQPSVPTDTTRWQIVFTRYIGTEKSVIGPVDGFILDIDTEGFTNDFKYEGFVNFPNESESEGFWNFGNMFFNICVAALHFMNCSKVEVKEVIAPKRLLGNKALKRGERQPINYKVLDIEPLKVLLKTEGKMDEVGIKQALTNVRGHWRGYTPEKPLFGRFVGKVFIKDHARGSSEVGIIKNTYNLKSPSDKDEP